jgi:hypothetical protein
MPFGARVGGRFVILGPQLSRCRLAPFRRVALSQYRRSLWDNPTCVLVLTHMRGGLTLWFNPTRQALPPKKVIANPQAQLSPVATALGLRDDGGERPNLGWAY